MDIQGLGANFRMVVIFTRKIQRWSCVYQECKAACCTPGRILILDDLERLIGAGYRDFAEWDFQAKLFKLKPRGEACIFLGPDLGCQIRQHEPTICKLLPFQIKSVAYSDELIIWLDPVPFCPGYGQGAPPDYQAIEAQATKLLKGLQQLQALEQEKLQQILAKLSSSMN